MFTNQTSNDQPMKAVLYARYSPRPGSRFGAPMPDFGPCDTQFEVCRRWCNLNKLDVLAEYCDEAKSGGRMDNRKGLEAALDFVCRERGVLVVFSLSRLARSTKDAIHIFERLRKAKADLVSLSETIDTTTAMGRFVFTLMAGIATLEREVTAERTRVSMLRHQANGRRMSDCCPYGWRRRRDIPALMEKDDDEQEVIERILREHRAGRSLRAIGRILLGDSILCRGGPWYHQTIKKIIMRAEEEFAATQCHDAQTAVAIAMTPPLGQ